MKACAKRWRSNRKALAELQQNLNDKLAEIEALKQQSAADVEELQGQINALNEQKAQQEAVLQEKIEALDAAMAQVARLEEEVGKHPQALALMQEKKLMARQVKLSSFK